MDFSITPFYTLGIAVWNIMLSMTGMASMQMPQSFSEGTWNYVAYTLYPWFSGIGAILLNIFFYIGMVRQTSNFKQNFTLEIFLEYAIRAVLANTLLQSGILIMGTLFAMAGWSSGFILAGTSVPFTQQDMDAGAVFFYLFFGVIFFAVSLVSSITIFLVVYGRFLQLYMLVVSYPIAISTMPGGQGISQTASSWLKTFLAKTFSVVVIAIAIVIAGRMCNSIDFGQLSGIGSYADGLIQALQNIFMMLLLASAVKGADVFMRRTFGL